MRSHSSGVGFLRTERSAEPGVAATASSVVRDSRPRSMMRPSSRPWMPCTAPRMRPTFALRWQVSTRPTRLWLITAVGPPDWPMRTFPCFLGMRGGSGALAR